MRKENTRATRFSRVELYAKSRAARYRGASSRATRLRIKRTRRTTRRGERNEREAAKEKETANRGYTQDCGDFVGATAAQEHAQHCTTPLSSLTARRSFGRTVIFAKPRDATRLDDVNTASPVSRTVTLWEEGKRSAVIVALSICTRRDSSSRPKSVKSNIAVANIEPAFIRGIRLAGRTRGNLTSEPTPRERSVASRLPSAHTTPRSPSVSRRFIHSTRGDGSPRDKDDDKRRPLSRGEV